MFSVKKRIRLANASECKRVLEEAKAIKTPSKHPVSVSALKLTQVRLS